jgi:hypothetical protein
MRVSLDAYKRLLQAIAAELSNIGDTKGAGLFLRWLRAIDELENSPHPNQSLRRQIAEVQRSAMAIVILATERYLSPTALSTPKQADLESVVGRLLSEAARLTTTLNTVDRVLTDRGLPELANEFLSSVEFVMDYVQLHFSGSTLTVDGSPEVREGHAVYRVNDPGYRDALCRRIGVLVRHVEVHEEKELVLSFSDDCSVHISLRAEDRVGAESATFSSTTGGFWVW